MVPVPGINKGVRGAGDGDVLLVVVRKLAIHIEQVDFGGVTVVFAAQHEHGRENGGGRLADAVRGISARTLLIAFSSDWLYPPSGSEELALALQEAGKQVELHVIDAPYGHDCFLLEEARQTPMIQKFLAR